MKLNHEAMECIESNMLDLALKYNKHYTKDLIIEINRLIIMNEEEMLPDTLIYIVRDCGIELGYRKDGRSYVDCYLDPLDKYPTERNDELMVFEIDVKKVASIKDIAYCDVLYGHDKYSEEYNCIKRIYESQTKDLNKLPTYKYKKVKTRV